MYWFMKSEQIKLVREKAAAVLKEIDYQRGKMISTTAILKAVEKLTGIDVKIKEFDFSKLAEISKDNERFARYGAAMYVSPEGVDREARVLLNSKETLEMQRFSLVHELGHLMMNTLTPVDKKYLFSTHIDMDITNISDEELKDNDFLVGEQMANAFALIVLIPYESLLTTMKKYDSLEEVAKIFGVEKNALLSRILIGINEEA